LGEEDTGGVHVIIQQEEEGEEEEEEREREACYGLGYSPSIENKQ